MQLCNYYQRQVQLLVNLLITFADVLQEDTSVKCQWEKKNM